MCITEELQDINRENNCNRLKCNNKRNALIMFIWQIFWRVETNFNLKGHKISLKVIRLLCNTKWNSKWNSAGFIRHTIYFPSVWNELSQADPVTDFATAQRDVTHDHSTCIMHLQTSLQAVTWICAVKLFGYISAADARPLTMWQALLARTI